MAEEAELPIVLLVRSLGLPCAVASIIVAYPMYSASLDVCDDSDRCWLRSLIRFPVV